MRHSSHPVTAGWEDWRFLAQSGCSLKAVSASTNRQHHSIRSLGPMKNRTVCSSRRIKVRSDCSLRGYSATKASADPCCEGRNGPQTLSECYEVLSNNYFFFFLAVFLAVFFAFFAFLAMLPSIIPKVVSMQADHRHACIQSTP